MLLARFLGTSVDLMLYHLERTNDDDFRQDLVDVEDMVNNVKGKEGTEKLTSKLQEKENDCNSISAMISEKVKVQNIFSSIVHSLIHLGNIYLKFIMHIYV